MKYFKSLVLAAIFAAAPSFALAATHVDVMVSPPDFNYGNGEAVVYSFWSSDGYLGYSFVNLPGAKNMQFDPTLKQPIVSEINNYASVNDYIVDSIMWWYEAPVQANWTATSGPSAILNKPTIPTVTPLTFATTTRSLNTAFQASTTKDMTVRYNVSIANVLTLTGGAAGDIVLETASNSGFTTNVVEQGRFGNSNTGGLVVGLTLNDAIKGQLTADVPAGYYVRLRTVTTTGTPTYTVVSSVERPTW